MGLSLPDTGHWSRESGPPAAYLGLKDESFQAVGCLLPLLLLQVSGRQLLQPVGQEGGQEAVLSSSPG